MLDIITILVIFAGIVVIVDIVVAVYLFVFCLDNFFFVFAENDAFGLTHIGRETFHITVSSSSSSLHLEVTNALERLRKLYVIPLYKKKTKHFSIHKHFNRIFHRRQK